MDRRCEKPLEVCMGIAPVPGVFDNPRVGRAITKEHAYEVLRQSEEAGLVHLTWNVESGHFFICNCCGCCCGVLRSTDEFGISDVTNSHYRAEIDPDECTLCGICADERCQVGAIDEKDESYEISAEKCIGCGLCITTCPEEAIQMKRRPESEIVHPPADEAQWYKDRGQLRGVDFSQYE